MFKRFMLAAAGFLIVTSLASARAVEITPAPPAANYRALNFALSGPQIAASCTREVERYKDRRLHIERVLTAKRTFASVIMPLENIHSDFRDALTAELFLSSVATEANVRVAAQRCLNRVSAVEAELDARPALYRAALDARASGTASTDAARKLTQLTIDQLRRSGAGLLENKRVTFIDLESQLSELELAFQARLRAAAPAIEITLGDAKSLPPDFVSSLRASANGGYLVPVDESRYTRFLSNEANPQARYLFLQTYLQRGGEQNVHTLERAIAVRSRIARVMGYPSWAAYVLSGRMAGTPARLRALLNDLSAGMMPLAQSQMALLTERKRKLTGDPSAVVESWDELYYANDVLKSDYAIDSDALRQYFGAERTVQATLDVYAKLFGLTFTRRDPGDAWSPDVLAYTVADAAGATPRGTLYLDLYARPGKYARFATFAVEPVRRAGETLRPAVTAIVGNWVKPASGDPPTLSHDEVVTFFHECGHAMANLLSTVPYESLNGYRWDFVEAPAQMLENWTWDPAVLAQLSSNIQTGKPLPPATINKVVASRRFNDAMTWLTQVTFARIDLAYHAGGAHVDTGTVWKNMFAGTPFPTLPDGSLPQAGLTHLMSGYDVGYYGYIWSKVYAQDMFSAFKTAGPEDPAMGQRFRSDILEPSRTYEPDELVVRFLGRPMSTSAFLRDIGGQPVSTAHR